VEGTAPQIRISVSDPSPELVNKVPGAAVPSGYVRIDVTDNGIGFEQDYADRIFTMFQRLSSGYEGTGIGLALCKKIVENHKGHIEATSSPGKGARFIIVLPRAQSLS